MRSICLHLLLLASTAAWAQPALVSGIFQNANAGEKVEVYVPHYYIDGKSSTYRTVFDAQGQFKCAVSVPEPQLVFLLHGDDRLPLYLEPNDTLIVRADMFQFPLLATFGGKSGANNSVLLQYFKENPQDFNEFNNLRFKIGQWWATIEEPENRLMEDLEIDTFRTLVNKKRIAADALLDEFVDKHPHELSPTFIDFLNTEITYTWAYRMLFYGQVYGGRHFVQPEFFDFLYDAPLVSNMVGSEPYRQFLITMLARRQAKSTKSGNFWAGAYELAGELLSDKSLAFSRSELIRIGFSGEVYRELLPAYNNFLQGNPYPEYDMKVTELYDKVARVMPGAPAPTFIAEDQNGKPISLGQFKGKIVYLNFWASWCGACLKKMEFFDEFSEELKTHGVEIVNISVDENPLSWKNTLAERPYKGAQLLASTGRGSNVAVLYGVEAVPQYFILDRNGNFLTKAPSGQPNDIRERLLQCSQ